MGPDPGKGCQSAGRRSIVHSVATNTIRAVMIPLRSDGCAARGGRERQLKHATDHLRDNCAPTGRGSRSPRRDKARPLSREGYASENFSAASELSHKAFGD